MGAKCNPFKIRGTQGIHANAPSELVSVFKGQVPNVS